jgi:hypothetical protein
MTDFRDLVDTEGLGGDEEARLRHVHDLLVQAGPPPDLPPSLERTPESAEAEILQFPLLPRRRWAAAALVAATLVAIAFGGGYLLGHSKGGPSAFPVERVVPMHGSGNAQAVLKIAKSDSAGNWPMEIDVTGLPKQANRTAYYELWLTEGHKPTKLCGSFRVHGNSTSAHFTVPYEFTHVDGWVVTAQPAGTREPGPVVLTT